MAWPCHPGAPSTLVALSVLVQDEHPMPPCMSPCAPLCCGVMQGLCHEGTASSVPILACHLFHLLLPCLGPWEALAGPGWGWAWGPIFPWHLPKIFVPLCPGGSFLGEPRALCLSVLQSVCPGTAEQGPVWGGSVWGLCPSAPWCYVLPVPTTPLMEMPPQPCPSQAGNREV